MDCSAAFPTRINWSSELTVPKEWRSHFLFSKSSYYHWKIWAFTSGTDQVNLSLFSWVCWPCRIYQKRFRYSTTFSDQKYTIFLLESLGYQDTVPLIICLNEFITFRFISVQKLNLKFYGSKHHDQHQCGMIYRCFFKSKSEPELYSTIRSGCLRRITPC